MKKRKKLQELNCWVVISIIVYVLILIMLVIAAFLSSDPKHSLWSFAAVVWAILGFLLPKETYLYTLRASLPTLREHAVVYAKNIKKEWYTYGSGSLYVPVITFRFKNGLILAFRVSNKDYRTFQCGETGTLVYKLGKGKAFFIDFIVHDQPILKWN